MPYNGSGVFSIVNSFTPNTTILSASVNQNFTDIATGLSDVLTRDGQAGMTATFKATSGSAVSPSISFSSDTTSGIYLIGSHEVGIAVNSANVLDIATTGLTVTGTLTATGQFPSAVGSVGAPTYTFTGDLDTGVYHIGANNIGVAVNGAKVIDISTSGIDVTGTVKVNGVPLTTAFPVPGTFKNLSIKVATTTTVAVAADFVTTTDGTNYQSTPVSGTCNLGTSGAVNALDTGTIATSTWYAIWVIAKSDGTTGTLASTSFTAPTLPSGYTYKARIGAVHTISATATLYGTWQLGRKVQYIYGLASTTTLPTIASGNIGTYNNQASVTYAASSVSAFVPSTASQIGVAFGVTSGNPIILIAPNSSYGPPQSSAPPLIGCASSVTVGGGWMMLESSNIYIVGQAGSIVLCAGWEDNL